jgi:cytochrome b subunit of formate dehydrogenase
MVDVVLALSFLALMSVPFTGLLLHEWWGLALIGVIVVHLLARWDWTAASTRRFLQTLTGRLRFTYVLNWLLVVAAVLVMVSGILISEAALPGLGLPTARSTGSPLFRFWRLLHTASADAVIVLAGIHLGLNWRWVLNAVRHVARLPRQRAARAASGGSHP